VTGVVEGVRVFLGRPPHPDEEQARVARGIHVLGLGAAAGEALALVHNWVVGRHRAALVLALGLAVVGFVLWLNRSRPRWAARVFAASLPLLATGLMFAGKIGFRDVASLVFPASLVVAGLLLDRASLVGLTVLSSLCVAAVILAETAGLIGGSSGAYPHLRQLLDATVILVLTAIGVGLVSEEVRGSLARSRKQELALADANAELERQAARLRESETRYRSLVELAADAIFVCDTAGAVSDVNRQACSLSGYSREELLGRSLGSLFSYEELRRSPLRYDLVQAGRTVVAERLLSRRDGSVVPVDMSSKMMPDGSNQSILRDVTERRRAEAERQRLEEQLRHSQKLEATGRLAGGVAHDFNNLLTAIKGSLGLALRDIPPAARPHRWLAEADHAADRAAALTRHLLAFGRKQAIAPRVVDLREVVEAMRPLLLRLIREDIALHYELPASPALVLVDPGQMEQIVLNLAANSRDAMPDGGRLSVEVALPDPASAPRPAEQQSSAEPVVTLTVTDTGHGMSAEALDHLFEPFFTTKPTGAGTGLGLAMVYGAVRQNRGTVDVDSVPGRGTAVRIALPRATGRAEAARSTQTSASPLRGSGTILLVEDEPAVREVAAEQLESLGYRVIVCSGAGEAEAAAARQEGTIHLLMTDVIMPGMNGRELARRIGVLRPGLRVLYTSGYGDEVISRHGVLERGVQFLPKPYTSDALSRSVREAMEA
jgi:two-component system, cell cycle sensor histidine kinase and response regulator CckA